MKSDFQTKWIFNDAVGIFLGILVASAIIFFEIQLIGQPESLSEKIVNVSVALIGGLITGSILAWFQYGTLRKRYAGLSWKRWWGNTALAFTAGWFIAIIPSLSFSGSYGFEQVVLPFGLPTYAMVYGSILLGAIMGALIGTAQWLILRKHRERARRWIGMNIFGWAFGAFIMTMSGLLYPGTELLNVMLMVAGVGGLLTALVLAGITSYFFRLPSAASSDHGRMPR